MYKKIVVLCVFSLLFVTSAFAQSIHLGPQVAYQKAKNADKGNLMYGAALRLKLLPTIGAEASINYRQEKYAEGALTVRSWPVMVSGLVYVLPVAYGIAGFGWYNTTFDYSSALNDVGVKDETKQEVGGHLGAGIELPLGTGTIITGDIRYVFLNYKFEKIPGQGDLSSNFYMINVGLLFGL